MIVVETNMRKIPSTCIDCIYRDAPWSREYAQCHAIQGVRIIWEKRKPDWCPLIEISDAVLAEGEVE